MNNGFIKIYRKMTDWEWYTDTNVKSLFIHCLLKANYTEKQWQGITIERGSFVTSYAKLSSELKLSVKQIRIAISKLKTTNEVAIKTTSKYSIITINNYDLYQEKDNQEDIQKANEGQAEGKQRATTKNIKNIKKDKNILNNTPQEDEKTQKNKYGEFKNVLLTDEEYNKLKNEFQNTDEAIQFLSAYIEEKGYKSKSHNLALRRWVFTAVKEKPKNQSKPSRTETEPSWLKEQQQYRQQKNVEEEIDIEKLNEQLKNLKGEKKNVK